MSPTDDPHALGRARLAFSDPQEADEFVQMLGRFERGELDAEGWRRFRLLRGIYPQLQEGAQMLRIKIPQGILSAEQLRAVAAVARTHSRGFGHLTTRQNIQLHFVSSQDLEPALRRLTAAGLTTREACGNSVRNVTACSYAGVAADEVFDVTPYAEALTRYFLGQPLASALPRKFKIAWEGCGIDHVQLGIHDIGFQARIRDEGGRSRRGFRVTVGGGTSILCRDGRELAAFLPAGEVLELAEAILVVFHELGDYEHRKRNRLKFLIESLGFERFAERVEAARSAVRRRSRPTLPFDADAAPAEEAPPASRPVAPTPEELSARVSAESPRGPGLVPRRPSADAVPPVEEWRRTNVRPQKQAGFVAATVTVPLGDLTASQMEVLAELSLAFGDGTVRTSSEQNLLLRWIDAEAVSDLHARLAAVGLAEAGAEGLADVVSCPGAESCRLAVTHSRGLGRLLGDSLRARPDLTALAPELRLRASGCPHGCGRHHVADIGFQGSMRKVGERTVPQYFVLVGGGTSGERTAFGRTVAKVPARRVPAAVERLLGLYASQRRPGETAREYLRRLPLAEASAALADLAALDEAGVTAEDALDLASD